MKILGWSLLGISLSMVARADFSYSETRKGSGGAADATTRHSLKGQKMKLDSGNTATIIDFDAQTLTVINNTEKTYSVTKFSDLGAGASGVEVKADVKETGQKKVINTYNCKEVVLTMDVDSPQAGPAGMKMQAEIDLWISPDVPGSQEMHAFYQKNASRFPWAALGGGGNPGMQNAMIDLQRKLASMDGVPVLETVKVKPTGGNAPTMSAAQQAQLTAARAQMEAMAKQGGPQAAAAQQALARMGAASGAGGALVEINMESSGFSTAAVADSVFSIPAGFQKTDRK